MAHPPISGAMRMTRQQMIESILRRHGKVIERARSYKTDRDLENFIMQGGITSPDSEPIFYYVRREFLRMHAFFR